MFNPNPFSQQESLTEKLGIPEEITEPDRSHSTLLVCYISRATLLGGFEERVLRLASSLNLNDTIKADIITVGDQKVYRGVYTGSERSVEPEGFDEKFLKNYTLIIKAENHVFS